jgi:putative flippase GtrA
MLQRLSRFLLTGFANSAVGWAVIIACIWGGMSGFAANASGYGVGLALSFTLNRRWVFGIQGATSRSEVTKFLAVFLIAYGANAGVLLITQLMLGPASLLAQVPAIAAYVLAFYLLSRRFVFRSPVAG